LTSRLKAWQRVYQISPRVEHMDELLASGLDSAWSVADMGEDRFVERFREPMGGDDVARSLFAQADQIHTTVTQIVTSAYQAMNDVNPAALGGPELADQLRKQLPDWASLFGRLDLCECAECRSVYGAAAYLVDLLQLINPSGSKPKPIEALRRRRRDLEFLKLTCENTNTLIPYIDLVNEALESYIVYGYTLHNDTSPSSLAEDLAVNREYGESFPESVTSGAATAVKHAVFPLSLPYDRSYHATQAYLGLLGTNVHELKTTVPAGHPAYALAGDYLGLSSTERNIWLGRLDRELREFYGYAADSVPVEGLWGEYFANTTLSGTPVFERADGPIRHSFHKELPSPQLPRSFSVRWTGILVPTQSRRTRLSFDGESKGYRFWLNDVLKLDFWNRNEVGHTEVLSLQAGHTYKIKIEYLCGGSGGEWTNLQWENEQGDPEHIPRNQLRCNRPWHYVLSAVPEFLRRTELSYHELLELLQTRYMNPNPESPNVWIEAQGDPSDLENSWLRGLTFDNYAPLRDAHRFLRLQRKLGWSIRDLDQALTAHGRERESFLVELADSIRLRREIGENRISREELYSLWTDLDASGDNSLYAKLFLNKALSNPPDPDFGPLSGGKEIRGHQLPLLSKKSQLLAVLRWKEGDLRAVTEEIGLAGPDAKLNLANLSKLHRYALLARSLSVAVPEMLALLRLTDALPFRSPADTLALFGLRREIVDSGFRIADLAYLLLDLELGAPQPATTDTAIAKLSAALIEGYRRIRDSSPPEETGELTAVFAIQKLSETLAIPETAASRLLRDVLRSADERFPEKPLLRDFLAAEQASIAKSFRRLFKAAFLSRMLCLEPKDIAYVHANKDDFRRLDFNLLPVGDQPDAARAKTLFGQWQSIARHNEARGLLLPGSPDWLELYEESKKPAASLPDLLERLEKMTGWPLSDLQSICGPSGLNLTPIQFANADRIPEIRKAARLTDRIGVPASRWLEWSKELPNESTAAETKNAAKSRYGEQTWRQVASAAENVLREKWRDALVDRVLQLPAIRQNGIANGNQLLEFFLIDVEMNAESRTSRIKQAISSVQLFVQRCLMNLEPGVAPGDVDRKAWEWMKSYRLWEANRKIFLYPENWLAPELRDDKTPIFKELEQEILQREINDENMSESLLKYLDQLEEVSRLDIRSVHRVGDDVHLFARTYSTPYRYYHRVRNGGGWTPWIRIEAEIGGEHLLAYSYQSSMYLFWGIFEKAVDLAANLPNDGSKNPKEKLRAKLAWSEYRNGRWSSRQIAEKPLLLDVLTPSSPVETERTKYYLVPEILPNGDLGVQFLYYFAEDGSEQSNTYRSEYCGKITFNDARKNNRAITYERGERPYRISLAPEQIDRTENFYYAFENIHLTVPVGKDGGFGGWVRLLDWVPEKTRFVVPPEHDEFSFYPENDPLVFVQQDHYRTYLATENQDRRVLYEILYHPTIRQFIQAFNREGLSKLLSRDAQLTTHETQPETLFKRTYYPTSSVVGPWPAENVDFSAGSAYGVYNWELFLHVPLLFADRLHKERRFQEALKWYEYVFNPTIVSSQPAPGKYWRFVPFSRNAEENRVWKLMTTLADPNGDPAVKAELRAEIAAWRENPFEPHRVARMRVSSYQKHVVMKYIDTLIAWGDDLFAMDTIESINEATQLYVMASNLLGPRPTSIPELTKTEPRSYAQLAGIGLDEFSNALVAAQNRFPFVRMRPAIGPGGVPIGTAVGKMLYFGIPRNDVLLGYWDKVEDRLAKIRHGLNLAGVARSLDLFETPIDPGAAVRAALAGEGGGSVLTDGTNAAIGYYRFSAVLPKAQELALETKALGAALLAALEKKDSEELNAIRARHESSLYRLVKLVRKNQIEDAKNALEGLKKTRSVTEHRHNHYRRLLSEGRTFYEHAQLFGMGLSVVSMTAANVADMLSAASHAVPDFTVGGAGISSPVATTAYGGSNGGRASSSFSSALRMLSAIADSGASMSGIMASHKRREEEWQLQKDNSALELEALEAQIKGAEIRLATAEKELANVELQIGQAAETEAYLRDKFTNRELYQWMAAQLTTLYFQTYQLAYNLAKRAERAYRFERGIENSGSSFIQFGYWDGAKKGLLAGERLHLDLKRLELAYLEQNSRDYEITKSVSLAQLDPLALIALKETGACEFSLPEELFDMDHPGHYMRRIKAVTISVPCVTGPYTGIHGRLTLDSSKIRASSSIGDGYKIKPNDPRFLIDFTPDQSIAFSHAQNDSGMFELSFRDERYLPFEGAGAISEWKLVLPRESNAFDFDTISDILLRISYTAREGGDELRKAAFESAVLEPFGPQGATPDPAVGLPAQPNLRRMFSLRHEFASEWHRFLHPASAEEGQSLAVPLEAVRFPFRYRGRPLSVNRMTFYLNVKDGIEYPDNGSPLEAKLIAPESGTEKGAEFMSSNANLHGMPVAEFDVSAEGKGFGVWTLRAEETAIAKLPDALKLSAGGRVRLNPDAVRDLVVVCDYAIL